MLFYSADGKDIFDLELRLRKRMFCEGLIRRFPSSKKHTLLRTGNGFTIGTNSFEEKAFMEGYRIDILLFGLILALGKSHSLTCKFFITAIAFVGTNASLIDHNLIVRPASSYRPSRSQI
jgi:hypothetical protein